VEAAGQYSNLPLAHFVDKPMFLVNASRPAPSQFMFQRLRFAKSGIWVALNIAHEPHDSQCFRPVVFDPPGEILERRLIKF
jgi:hypothetical protein